MNKRYDMLSKNSISNVLKEYRKRNNYKVSEVAIYLSNEGKPVAEKTVYGWESGQSLPDAECLIKLCALYNIVNVPRAFGYKNNIDSSSLSAHETEVIRRYRQASNMQNAVDRLLGIEQEHSNISAT